MRNASAFPSDLSAREASPPVGNNPKTADPLPVISATRIWLITVSIVGVSLLSLLVAVLGSSVPGALHR